MASTAHAYNRAEKIHQMNDTTKRKRNLADILLLPDCNFIIRMLYLNAY